MTTLPAELIRPKGFEQTDSPHVMKPTFGSVGSQYVRFHVHLEYSGSDSEAKGIEVKRPIELCEIQNDKFTRVPIRVNDLSPRQKVELAPLYERFKSQKDSNETSIADWEAITDMEKGLLMTSGVYTVEQLDAFGDEELYKLGPSGKDLKLRASRHVRAKRGPDVDKVEELRREMQLIIEENKRLQAKEHEYFARAEKRATLEAITPVKKKGGRPKKQKTTEEIAQ